MFTTKQDFGAEFRVKQYVSTENTKTTIKKFARVRKILDFFSSVHTLTTTEKILLGATFLYFALVTEKTTVLLNACINIFRTEIVLLIGDYYV